MVQPINVNFLPFDFLSSILQFSALMQGVQLVSESGGSFSGELSSLRSL